MRQANRKPTLEDVGREAGVSGMTASLVLNNPTTSSRVSDATRNRVMEAARLLGYKPSGIPKSEPPVFTQSLGVTLVTHTGFVNPYQQALLNGIYSAVHHYDQTVTIFILPHWHLASGRLEEFCSKPTIDGMILLAPTMTEAMVKGFVPKKPLVTIHANVGIPHTIDLHADDEQGGYLAVDHLIRLGHRRILQVTGPKDLSGLAARAKGWRRALREANLEEDDLRVDCSGLSFNHGLQATDRWLTQLRGELPTGIVCTCDLIAMGCIAALARHGLRVPQDISVVGFDDLPFSGVGGPALTTIAQPFQEMGNQAVEHLIEMAVGTPVEDIIPEIPDLRLMVRESSGPVAERLINLPLTAGDSEVKSQHDEGGSSPNSSTP